MTRNPKGVLGQIEGLKESFEGVLRKRTQYRQQINQLTACLRERNRTIRDLKVVNQALNEEIEKLADKAEYCEAVLKDYKKGKLNREEELRISRDEWREKARALAAELHERGGNGEMVEEDSSFDPLLRLTPGRGKSRMVEEAQHESPLDPGQNLRAFQGGV